jgi:glutamate/tyrosine decarboxylase-like PLP-dependent enzyme
VIGWSWLFFGSYDFGKNPLGISAEALGKIKEQYEKVSELKYADSWGVDFHKGIGGCPVDCRVVLFYNPGDVFAISKSKDARLTTHLLATEFTNYAPSEFTLETSRSGGTGFAALSTLRSLGAEGYQRNLANLIESTCALRETLEQQEDIKIVNDYSLGFSTMVRIYPPELLSHGYPSQEFKATTEASKKNIESVNKYIKAFYKWDFETRISKNEGSSPSCSSSFFEHQGMKISALKFYPTSPHFSAEFAKEAATELITRKAEFVKKVWLPRQN